MSKFVCDDCNREFKANQNLQYHIKSKTCKRGKFGCKYCNKNFTSQSNMYRHIRTVCKVKKATDQQKDEIYERLVRLEEMNARVMEENKKYAKEIEKLKSNSQKMERVIKSNKTTRNINNGVNINGHNVNINNGIINNVTLIAHGKEDVSKIDRSELIKVFGSGFNSTLKLTETMHFNPKYPEFHNVYISSMKNKYAMVYDGNDWTLVMKDDLIDRMYDNKRDYIEENFDEFLNSLTPSQNNALHRWMNAGDSHPYIAKIKNEIKLLLYNKRKMAIENNVNSHKTNYIEEIEDIDNLDKDNKDAIKQNIKVRVAGRPGTKRKMAKVRRARFR